MYSYAYTILIANDPIVLVIKPAVIWAVIYFIVTLIVGYIVSLIVVYILRRGLNRLASAIGLSKEYVDAAVGGVYAFIMLIALAIALGYIVSYLGPASTYVSSLIGYLPYLGGAILLFTLGLLLVDGLATYVQRRLGISEGSLMAFVNLLRLGLYAVIIAIGTVLAIMYWIPSVSTYLFYDIIIAAVVVFFGVSLVNSATSEISKAHPELSANVDYIKLILNAIIVLLAVAILVQPFTNITQIIYALAWGFAIAFAIVIIPVIYTLAKKMVSS